ncbi:MAG: hypothetical protein ACFB2Z_03100 [Maricaulaceae bacterium]
MDEVIAHALTAPLTPIEWDPDTADPLPAAPDPDGEEQDGLVRH